MYLAHIIKGKVGALVALIAFASLFWHSTTLQNLFMDMLEVFKRYSDENTGAAIFLFLIFAALSAMLAPFSSIPLVPISVAVWGSPMTLVLLLTGWITGGVAAYFIGYVLGRPVVRHIITEEKINYYRSKIPARSEFTLLLLFRLAMPAEIPGYLLGMIRYHFAKYVAITLLAEIPFALIAVYASEAFLEERRAVFISLAVTGGILFGTLFYLFHRGVDHVKK